MSDEDLIAVTGYLRSLPAQENVVERRRVGFLSRNTKGFWYARKQVRGYVPSLNRSERIAYGEYLTDHVSNCAFCHNSPSTLFGGEGYLAGGKPSVHDDVEKVAPALDGSEGSAIRNWSEKDIVQYLKTGRSPDNRQIGGDFCPWTFYRNAEDGDLEAVAAYLKTVPAP